MVRSLAVAILMLAACGCTPKPRNMPDGASCNRKEECASLHCQKGYCTSGKDGSPCTAGIYETGCSDGFSCIEDTCKSPASAAADRKQADAAKERELLEKSGVDVKVKAPVAEQPAAAAAPGARIRVVTTKSKGSAFASCRTDERLTGGSCVGPNLEQNGPTGVSSDDTVGARWSCYSGAWGVEITAVALCASTKSMP